MATADPLKLDTFAWREVEVEEATAIPGNDDTACDRQHAAERNGISRQESTSTAKTEAAVVPQASKSVASTMNDEARLARRASRKQRPTRSRSLLDEMAADKALRNITPATPMKSSEKPYTDPSTSDTAPTRISKPAPRLSDERRRFMQSTLDEQEEDQAVLEDNKTDFSTSPASNASTTNTRVSFETTEGFLFSDTIVSPITIPSASGPFSLASPRPSLGVRTKSSAPERRLSRRTSTRTSASSWSPASAFLARWSRDETASAQEPDEDGQEIGGNSGYIIGRQIGFGGFSVVKEAHTIEKGEKVLRAVKIVRKHLSRTIENNSERAQQEFEHEITIWRYLKHKRILPLLAVFDTDFATFCIMQISSSGSLFDVVAHYRRQSSGRSIGNLSRSSTSDLVSSPQSRSTIPLTHAKHYMAQIASALRYLHHDVRIVHRDIKLENCLINPTSGPETPLMKRTISVPFPAIKPFPGFPGGTSEDSELSSPPGDILLCDFGMADFIAQEDRDDRLTLTSLDGDSDAESADHRNPQKSATNESMPTNLNTQNLGPGPNDATFSPHLPTKSPNNHKKSTATDLKDHSPPTDPETIIAGSLAYAAPELFQSSTPLYSPAADIWAFGVLSYALLVGEVPFRHGLQSKVVGMIEEGAWDVGALKSAVGVGCDAGVYGSEVENAAECVEGCLRLDLERRWSVRKVVRCQFLEEFREYEDVAGHGDGGL